MAQKMSLDNFASPSISLVIFDDTIPYPLPKECQAFFEWFLNRSVITNIIKFCKIVTRN